MTSSINNRINNLIFSFSLKGDFNKKGFHLDYENGEYRQVELAKIIRGVIEEYALTPDEIKKFSSIADWDEMRRHAWKRISTAHKNKKGDYGEVLLYILLNYFYKIEKFTTKVRLRSALGDQIKGFDCAHFEKKGDNLTFWLGEAKLRKDFSSAISSVFDSIETLTNINKIKDEFIILSTEIEVADKELKNNIITELSGGKSIDKISIKIPVLVSYEFSKLKEYSETSELFRTELESHFIKKFKKIENMKNEKNLKFDFLFFLLPLENMDNFKSLLEIYEDGNR